MTLISPRKRTRAAGRPFSRGYDCRRHILTREEQSRGGRTTWNRYMRQWRAEMNLFGGYRNIAKVENVKVVEGTLAGCPICGGPIIQDGQVLRCTRCGYSACDGCGGTGQEGGQG